MNDGQLRLLADCMLGSLAKWLRILGYDTAYENEAADPELAHRARAEGRVLLTRDYELSNRRGLNTLFIHSEKLKEQIQEVQEALGPPPNSALSRCPVCNAPLEPISHAEASKHIPPYIAKTQTEFRRCLGCDRIYWPGTHIDEIQKQMEKFDVIEAS